MNRRTISSMMMLTAFLLLISAGQRAHAQSFQLTISNTDLTPTPVFSSVSVFSITISIDQALEPGTYSNPPISRVDYQVTGSLAEGTPSGFESFDLQRDISGTEFYAQGSSLTFTISPTAVLDDGLQVAELSGTTPVLVFNAREIGNGRFHPPIFSLNSDGTGQIQNTDNVPDAMTQVAVDPGSEYITDIAFDPGNLTIVSAPVVEGDADPMPSGESSSGGGALGWWGLVLMGAVAVKRRRR